MITTPLSLLAFILFATALLVYLYKTYLEPMRFAIPLVLVIYLFFMLTANSDFILLNQANLDQMKVLRANLLPAMIFLMMLSFRIDLFKRLGKKAMIAFFGATLSIIFSFISVFYLFKSILFTDAAPSFATLAGSWSGGTVNMIAVSQAVGLDAATLGSVIAVDTILYSFWLLLLLALVPLASRFNRLTKATVSHDTVYEESCPIANDTHSYIRIILLSIIVAFAVNFLGTMLPQSGFLNPTFYAVILATLLGVIASFTPLRYLNAHTVAESMLYLIIALIALQAQIEAFDHLGTFLFLGAMILLFHLLFMLLIAFIFKLDLFSIGVASLAHIGGIASAPILASSYHRSLIPVGVAMATVGYLLGTMVGMFIAFMLGALTL